MIRRLLPLKFGRLTPAQTTALGRMLPSVGYIGIGPVVVLVNLPGFLKVSEPVPSVFDINTHLREVYASQGKPVPAWIPPAT